MERDQQDDAPYPHPIRRPRPSSFPTPAIMVDPSLGLGELDFPVSVAHIQMESWGDSVHPAPLPASRRPTHQPHGSSDSPAQDHTMGIESMNFEQRSSEGASSFLADYTPFQASPLVSREGTAAADNVPSIDMYLQDRESQPSSRQHFGREASIEHASTSSPLHTFNAPDHHPPDQVTPPLHDNHAADTFSKSQKEYQMQDYDTLDQDYRNLQHTEDVPEPDHTDFFLNVNEEWTMAPFLQNFSEEENDNAVSEQGFRKLLDQHVGEGNQDSTNSEEEGFGGEEADMGLGDEGHGRFAMEEIVYEENGQVGTQGSVVAPSSLSAMPSGHTADIQPLFASGDFPVRILNTSEFNWDASRREERARGDGDDDREVGREKRKKRKANSSQRTEGSSSRQKRRKTGSHSSASKTVEVPAPKKRSKDKVKDVKSPAALPAEMILPVSAWLESLDRLRLFAETNRSLLNKATMEMVVRKEDKTKGSAGVARNEDKYAENTLRAKQKERERMLASWRSRMLESLEEGDQTRRSGGRGEERAALLARLYAEADRLRDAHESHVHNVKDMMALLFGVGRVLRVCKTKRDTMVEVAVLLTLLSQTNLFRGPYLIICRDEQATRAWTFLFRKWAPDLLTVALTSTDTSTYWKV